MLISGIRPVPGTGWRAHACVLEAGDCRQAAWRCLRQPHRTVFLSTL